MYIYVLASKFIISDKVLNRKIISYGANLRDILVQVFYFQKVYLPKLLNKVNETMTPKHNSYTI